MVHENRLGEVIGIVNDASLPCRIGGNWVKLTLLSCPVTWIVEA
jgi:hypothetical protein